MPADIALDVDYRKELQRREALPGVPGAARATPKDSLKELDQQIVNGADNPLFAIPQPQDRSLPDPGVSEAVQSCLDSKSRSNAPQ